MTVGEKSAKRQDAIQQIMFREIYFWRAKTFVMQRQQTQLGAVQMCLDTFEIRNLRRS